MYGYPILLPSFQTRHLSDQPIPNLSGLDFNDFSLGSDQMVVAAIAIFKETGLLKTFRIDYEVTITVTSHGRHWQIR